MCLPHCVTVVTHGETKHEFQNKFVYQNKMLTTNIQSYLASCSTSIIDSYTRIVTSIQILSFLNLQKSQERVNNQEC